MVTEGFSKMAGTGMNESRNSAPTVLANPLTRPRVGVDRVATQSLNHLELLNSTKP